jgi:hypothetical protein
MPFRQILLMLLCLFSCTANHFEMEPFTLTQGRIRENRYFAPNNLFSVDISYMKDKKWMLQEFFQEEISPGIVLSDGQGTLLRIELIQHASELEKVREKFGCLLPICHHVYEEFIKEKCPEAKTIYWEDITLEQTLNFFAVVQGPNLSALDHSELNLPEVHFRGILYAPIKNNIAFINIQTIPQIDLSDKDQVDQEIALLRKNLLEIFSTFRC